MKNGVCCTEIPRPPDRSTFQCIASVDSSAAVLLLTAECSADSLVSHTAYSLSTECCAYRKFCVVPTESFVLCLPKVLCCAYRKFCIVPTESFVLCLPKVLCCAYRKFCFNLGFGFGFYFLESLQFISTREREEAG